MDYLNYVDKDGTKHRKKIFIINNRKMIKLGKDNYISKNKFLKQQGGGIGSSRHRQTAVHTDLSTRTMPIQPKARLHSSLQSNINEKLLRFMYSANRSMTNERIYKNNMTVIRAVNPIILNQYSAEESFRTLDANKKKMFLEYLKIVFLQHFELYAKLFKIFIHIYQFKDSIKSEIESNSLTQRTIQKVINKLYKIKHFVATDIDNYFSSVPYDNVLFTRDIDLESFRKLLEICKRILFEIDSTNFRIEQLDMNTLDKKTYQLNERHIKNIILEFIQKISNLELNDRRAHRFNTARFIQFIHQYLMSYIIKMFYFYIHGAIY